ncbi:Kef-type K+ transport system membrane component KefB/nucleotide-binding universal stress UspA family protein [Lewinella aquimaris]|uniref:Kef-type K+ transport system membrane component KefB/nucleotide-binding universal stress UspA family protein n=1 Tax=Neolewinella aquimaris TaxID=1835722 RepID=A0A840DZ28_9BACT|nr:cation:proton antiporter [Neolewinella aquimaris]MBB4078524.1 Kef-type K+ transport system membrane component KefB/nucleotide-binding universal stress UspA family protein [Neolewinella aquimaris]
MTLYLEITASLPLTDPVVKFLLILLIILIVPLLLNKVRIPHLLGLIIAGAVIGPNGFNLMERDSGIILSGTAGLLYIMFLAGLEIDLADFKKNSRKSVVFGMYTFLIPMGVGILAGIYVLKFSVPTSVLLASMFASHTLIAYPMVSRLGVAKNRAVNIAVGGTVITDVLALLVLAVIVGMNAGEVTPVFWVRMGASIVAFGGFVLFGFPLIGRWFLKRFDDNVSQYIFVLAMVFFGAALAELAGIEPIIGAFLAGLGLNRLIPLTSPLMNRIEFVGNAIFIPFFLIGVGMLIDYRAFTSDPATIRVAMVMTAVATASKFAAAWLTQQTFRFTVDERRLIFGLSNAQAAATLAAVLVGYNTIIGQADGGEPIRLLNENVLNGTILMILITCTTASLVAQKGARNLARTEEQSVPTHDSIPRERILIPVSNQDTTDELINLGVTIKQDKTGGQLYALSVVDHDVEDPSAEARAKKILHRAAVTASATDNKLLELLRYDLSIVNGITSVVKEHRMTDLIMGLHVTKGISDTFLGHLTEGILTRCNITTLLYKPAQPFATIKRHLIILPARAEQEPGFQSWLAKVWNIGRNSGARMVFYGPSASLAPVRELNLTMPIDAAFTEFDDWNDFLILSRDFTPNDNLILIMSRTGQPSFQRSMQRIPHYLNKYFQSYSFIIIYPMQEGVEDSPAVAFRDPSLTAPLKSFNKLGKSIAGVLKR